MGVTSKVNQVWIFWLTAGVLIVAIQLATLKLYPVILQDGVQILDFGRVFLDPSTTWSTGWLVHESRPMLPVSYLGGAIQELAYAATAPSIMGVRVLSVISALLASACALGWLMARGTPRLPAFILSMAFLLDPIFNVSYREGRVDGWAFAACFAVCWMLRTALNRAERGSEIRWLVFLAGVLLAASPFFWISAGFLLPLMVLEFFCLLLFYWRFRKENGWAGLRSVIFWFTAGGVISAAVLLLPIMIQWEHYAVSLEVSIALQKTAAVIQRSLIDMFLLYDPLIIVAALVSLLARREWGVIIALTVALAMMYQTMVYPQRIMYLLPYFAAIAGGACAILSLNRSMVRRRIIVYGALAFLLAWNMSITLVKRPVIALHQKQARSPENIQAALADAIGPGPYRVLLEEWDPYFAARGLGWKIYKPFGRFVQASPDYRQLLESMDYVILRKEFLWMKVDLDLLEASGFELHSQVTFPQPASSEISWGPFSFRGSETIYEDLSIYHKAPVRRGSSNQP